ncbi:sterol-binding protein [Streptomyces sp. J2-1]|uniref:SCP2 sterol-binding domain-containing protein n=1 Tax=Streptomyces corallincola TaxID=2851888 RepID=UPI001C392ABB|nr:SCP2 sterol-binding domain-containing protein [Streptomyces corallincola]MBV2356610.1 sterol-binding protein [Streptomyces corallincola]
MATVAECRTALEKLSENMRGAGGDVRAAAALDRTVSCHLTDLDTTFAGRLTGGRIEVDDTLPGPPGERAQIRLALTGDDLVALVSGGLDFAAAWASGRVRLEASLLDLFRLRKLL